MKKLFYCIIAICIIFFSGCEKNIDEVTVLKFKNTNSNSYINSLNGKTVSITGYISTISPLSGEFAYLMNMPYQSCPYCIPGTSEITNTLAIFAGENDKIELTDMPVTVTGTLKKGEFSDEYGYEYGVRLNNVTVVEANIDELSEQIKKYNLLAENGVVGDIYNCIMNLDFSIFYDYYELPQPEKVILDDFNYTKNSLTSYNTNGDYDELVILMDHLIALANYVNNDIDNSDYSRFTEEGYQAQLQDLYFEFDSWAAEGEL